MPSNPIYSNQFQSIPIKSNPIHPNQEKVHSYKRFDAAGIKDGTVLHLLNDYRGGGGKRGRLEEPEDININCKVPKLSTLTFQTS